MKGLANVYLAQGRQTEAISLLKRVLAIEEEVLGPDHPQLAVDLAGYARVLHLARRKTEASQAEARANAIMGRRK